MNPSSAINHPPSACRILVRGVNWLGDAVMSTPALLRLRERFPEAHITLLTPKKLRDLWLHHPAIDEVIAFETGESVFTVASRIKLRYKPRLEAFDKSRQYISEVGKGLQEMDLPGALDSARRAANLADPLERRNFNLALVLPNSHRSAIEVWLASIPRRIGYARPWRNYFLTQTVAPRPGAVEMHKRSAVEIERLIAGAASRASSLQNPTSAHHLHQYLHLTATLAANPEPLAPQLFVTTVELEAAEKKFALDEQSTDGRPLLGLIPGAEYGPAKRWPVERFAAAAREIQQRTQCIWLVLGGQADVELAEQVVSAIRNPQSAIRNLSGQTSLRELMAVLKLSRLLLTNDTGPMHVAAALGTPVVVPFGSTSPELTGPGLPGDERHRLLKSDAPCSPCFRRECPIDFRCMQGINVERVVAEAAGILNR